MITLEESFLQHSATTKSARQRQKTAAGQRKARRTRGPPGTEASVPGTASDTTQIGRNSVRHRNPDVARPTEKVDVEKRRRRRQNVDVDCLKSLEISQ